MSCKAMTSLDRTSFPLLILIVISLFIGIFAFSYGTYKSSTLVIEAKTLHKGSGRIKVDKWEVDSSVFLNFKIPYDQGTRRMYVNELPAICVKSIEIAPFGKVGEFEFDRIILSNGTVSYFWNEQGECSQQMKRNGFLIREACFSGSPELRAFEDGSVVISSIPKVNSERSFSYRMALAMIFMISSLLGGVWLLKPGKNKTSSMSWQSYAVRFSWLLLVGLYAWQISLVYKYSVDMPFEDGWDYFKASSLSHDLSWRWLISFHVEDRIIMTRLLAWLNLRLFGLDFDLQEMLNMILYGVLLATLIGFKNNVTGRGTFQFYPLFLVFLLSTMAVENHLWSFQAMYHLVLIFSIAALSHAYKQEMTCRSACIFSLYMFLAMSTFTAWVVFGVVYLFCISVYIFAGIRGGRINRLSGLRFLLIICTTLFGGVLLYYHGYMAPEWPPLKLYPNEIRFWNYFLNIVSFGFGFDAENRLPGMVSLLFTASPLFVLLVRKESRWRPSTWQVLTAILGILAVLAAITLGRGNFAEPKTSRYSEFGMMLIPLSALAWWLVCKEGGTQKVILPFLWLVCCGSFLNNWSTQKYAEEKQIELYNLECVEGYYNGIGDGVCQGRTTASDLDRARDLGAKFTRQFHSIEGGGR